MFISSIIYDLSREFDERLRGDISFRWFFDFALKEKT
jgi:hypothetical protein